MENSTATTPPQAAQNQAGQTSSPPVPDAPESHGPSIIKVAIIASVVFFAVVFLVFAFGVVFALSDIDRAGEFIRLIRDVFIIVLSMSFLMIVAALTVLIIQVASLANLLQTEIKPLLENLQATMNTVSGTARFVGTNVAQPLIKAGGFMAGVAVFARELGGIRKALSRSEQNQNGKTPAGVERKND